MAIIKAVTPAQIAQQPNSAPAAPAAPQMRAPEPTRVVQAPTAPQTPKTPPISSDTPKSAPIAPPVTIQEEKIDLPDAQALSEPKLIKNEAQIADSDFTLNDVKKNWGRFIVETKTINHSLSAVLQSCQPVSVEAGIVTVATKFTFHKDKLNEYGNKLTLEETFAKILGLRLLIKVITAEEAGITIASSLNQNTNSAPVEQAPHTTSSLLSDAMGIMGGQIVE